LTSGFPSLRLSSPNTFPNTLRPRFPVRRRTGGPLPACGRSGDEQRDWLGFGPSLDDLEPRLLEQGAPGLDFEEALLAPLSWAGELAFPLGEPIAYDGAGLVDGVALAQRAHHRGGDAANVEDELCARLRQYVLEAVVPLSDNEPCWGKAVQRPERGELGSAGHLVESDGGIGGVEAATRDRGEVGLGERLLRGNRA
jgi:hypothetical protein